jgi:ATP-binding cassette subfamily B protein
VVEHGRVVEIGSHDELIALGGRYREMFELQARPFAVVEGEEEAVLDALA